MDEPLTDRDRPPLTTAELVQRASALIAPDRRTLLGITGPPGAGKSTLAAALESELRPSAVIVPMDGFHRSRRELAELGRLERIGAPDTFDAQGFVALIREIRRADEAESRTLAAPAFDRTIEAPAPNAIQVTPDHRLVIVEGNYLLLDEAPWSELRELLDQVWYVDLDDAERLDRLTARHVAFGKSPAAARAWSLGPDESNARLIAASRGRADLVVWPGY